MLLLCWNADKSTKISLYWNKYIWNVFWQSQIQRCTYLLFAQKLKPEDKDEDNVSINTIHYTGDKLYHAWLQ